MRMAGNSILVKLDPESTQLTSGLFRPENAHEHVLRTAEVVAVGPGKFVGDTSVREDVGVKVGDGVVFIKFLATHTESAKGLQGYLGKDLAIIQPLDVMLAYDRKEAPVFSQ